MAESLIMEKLEKVDAELHTILTELKSKEAKESKVSLEELRRLMKSHVKEDIDTTKLIREMREKEYDV